MSTANDVYTELVAAVDAIAGSHLASDYREDVALPSGTHDFQVRVDEIRKEPDSNIIYSVVEIEVSVFRDVGASESSAELDGLRTLQGSLTARSFLDNLATVRECIAAPEVVDRMQRTGNVIHFTVRATATVQP